MGKISLIDGFSISIDHKQSYAKFKNSYLLSEKERDVLLSFEELCEDVRMAKQKTRFLCEKYDYEKLEELRFPTPFSREIQPDEQIAQEECKALQKQLCIEALSKNKETILKSIFEKVYSAKNYWTESLLLILIPADLSSPYRYLQTSVYCPKQLENNKLSIDSIRYPKFFYDADFPYLAKDYIEIKRGLSTEEYRKTTDDVKTRISNYITNLDPEIRGKYIGIKKDCKYLPNKEYNIITELKLAIEQTHPDYFTETHYVPVNLITSALTNVTGNSTYALREINDEAYPGYYLIDIDNLPIKIFFKPDKEYQPDKNQVDKMLINGVPISEYKTFIAFILNKHEKNQSTVTATVEEYLEFKGDKPTYKQKTVQNIRRMLVAITTLGYCNLTTKEEVMLFSSRKQLPNPSTDKEYVGKKLPPFSLTLSSDFYKFIWHKGSGTYYPAKQDRIENSSAKNLMKFFTMQRKRGEKSQKQYVELTIKKCIEHTDYPKPEQLEEKNLKKKFKERTIAPFLNALKSLKENGHIKEYKFRTKTQNKQFRYLDEYELHMLEQASFKDYKTILGYVVEVYFNN